MGPVIYKTIGKQSFGSWSFTTYEITDSSHQAASDGTALKLEDKRGLISIMVTNMHKYASKGNEEVKTSGEQRCSSVVGQSCIAL